MYEDEIPVGKAKDLRGKKIGNLTILYRVKNGCPTGTRWKCLCDCGNITYHYATNLLNDKYSHSCGCQSKRGENLKISGYHGQNKIDITGQKFGRLTALKDSSERKGGEVVWLCQCDCGSLLKVRSYDLRRGHTSSCGCLRSKGEEKIKNIFSQNNINYISQKTFADCVNDRGNLLKFDIYLEEMNYCIEYDGDIHYDVEHSRGWFNDEYREGIKNI